MAVGGLMEGLHRRRRHHDTNDVRGEGLCKCRSKGSAAATDRRRSRQKFSSIHGALPFVFWPPVRDASSECLRLHPSEARVKDYPKRPLWNNIIVASSHNIQE